MTAADLRDDYTLAAGEMTFDLDRMTWPEEPVVIDASVTFGRIEVHVPRGVVVEMEGHADMGEIVFFSREQGGINVDASFARRGPSDAPALVVEAATSMGAIDVSGTGEPAVEEAP